MARSKAEREHHKLESTAYHEAGHAVACIVCRLPFRYVTIEPKEDSLGHILTKQAPVSIRETVEFDPGNPKAERWLEQEVLTTLAGPAAEAEFAGRYNHTGATSDFHSAVDMALRLMHDEVIGKYLDYMRAKALYFVRQPHQWIQIEGLAAALMEHKNLTARRAREVCVRARSNRDRFEEICRALVKREEARQQKLAEEWGELVGLSSALPCSSHTTPTRGHTLNVPQDDTPAEPATTKAAE